MRRKVSLSILVALLALSACASTGGLSPKSALITNLNEVVIGVGVIQSSAIALNTTSVCTDPTPTAPPKCVPILSDANTRVVVSTVTDLLTTLRTVPAGSKATILKALDVIDARLDSTGREKLHVYVSAARTLALGLIGAN